MWLREELVIPNIWINLPDNDYTIRTKLNQKLKIKKAIIKKDNLNVEFTDGIQSNYRINEIISEINKNIFKKKFFMER